MTPEQVVPEVASVRVVIGQIAGVFGVKGWLKVRSHTDPIENLLQYKHWQLGSRHDWRPCQLLEGRRHGKGLIARIENIEDPEQARSLVGAEIAVDRAQLAATAADEIYWVDLIGLEVVTIGGQSLGKVHHLVETGANDVLIVRGEREHCVPYIKGDVIRQIDLEAALITVDWDADF